jgi:hypothetical protein
MFELRKDASRTKAPPYNLYTIVVSGIEQEAIRTRGACPLSEEIYNV